MAKLGALNQIAARRGQTLAQMALAWLLRDERVTSVLIGASKPQQVTECVGCLRQPSFEAGELDLIEHALASAC